MTCPLASDPVYSGPVRLRNLDLGVYRYLGNSYSSYMMLGRFIGHSDMIPEGIGYQPIVEIENFLLLEPQGY